MNDFKLTLTIEKAFQKTGADGTIERYVRGKASGTELDLEREKMAQTAILSFKRAIEQGIYLRDGQWSLIPLRSGHRDEWDDILGWIEEAEIDKDYNLYITAKLDSDNPSSDMLYRKLTRQPQEGRPVKLGLSVGGTVVSAGQEWDELLQSYVRVYYDVALKEVSVVSQPAYPTAYLTALAKSVDWSKVKGRTVLVSEDELMEDMINTEAETTEKSVEEKVDATTDTAVAAETVAKTEEVVVEETEVEKTETVEDATATEPVEKAVEEATTGVEQPKEVVKTDPMDELRSTVADMMKELTTLANAVAALSKSEAATEEAEVIKAADEGTQEQVAEPKAAEEVVVERAVESAATEEVAKAEAVSLSDIAAVVKAAIVEAVKPLEARIEEIESTPVDKSLAVEPHVEQHESVLEKFQRELGELKGRDALRAALVMGLDEED